MVNTPNIGVWSTLIWGLGLGLLLGLMTPIEVQGYPNFEFRVKVSLD